MVSEVARTAAEDPGTRRVGVRRALLNIAGEPRVTSVGRRLLLAIPLLFAVTALCFILVSLTPGDPALQILGENATPEAYAQLQEELGLNRPLHEQYTTWVSQAIQGDFGTSLSTGEAVTRAINTRLPVTLSLILLSLVVTTVVGVGLGVLSAARGGAVGQSIDGFSLIAFALPSFWIGLVLISIFAVRLPWFPAVGYVPFAESPRGWLQSLALPVIALSLHSIAVLVKQTREAMLDTLGSEHIRAARANGVPESSILLRHSLKSASIRVVTIVGLLTVGLLSGTVVVESVFALPGVGGLAVEATLRQDLPVVLGVVVYFTIIVVLVNLLVDLTYTWLNPRVRAR